eukprot:8207391-Pyramimonas_sp.AAC.1
MVVNSDPWATQWLRDGGGIRAATATAAAETRSSQAQRAAGGANAEDGGRGLALQVPIGPPCHHRDERCGTEVRLLGRSEGSAAHIRIAALTRLQQDGHGRKDK